MAKRKVADLFSLRFYCTTALQKVGEETVNNPLNFHHAFLQDVLHSLRIFLHALFSPWMRRRLRGYLWWRSRRHLR